MTLNLIKKSSTFERIIYIIFLFLFMSHIVLSRQIWLDENITIAVDKINQIIELVQSTLIIKLLLLIELFIIVLKLFTRDKKQISYLLKAILFLCIYYLMKRYAYYFRFERLVLIIYFSKEVDFSTILKIFIISNVTGILISVLGCISGDLSLITKGRGYSFGFSHSNQTTIYVVMLFFALSYFVKNIKQLLITVIPFFVLLFYIKSRTAFILLILYVLIFVVFNYLLKKRNIKISKIIKILYVLLPIVLLSVSFILSILYNNGINLINDGNYASRFIELIQIYNEKGLALYYRDLLDASKHYYLDNGYGQLLFRHGLITFLVFYFYWIIGNVRAVTNNAYKFTLINAFIYIYLLMEFICLVNDLPLILMTYGFVKKDNDNFYKFLDKKVNLLLHLI